MPTAPKSNDEVAARSWRSAADPVARAVALGPSIRAAADEIERTRRIPKPLLTELHEAGLLRLFLPKVYGGGEVHPGVYLGAVLEVARHDASVGWNMFVANSSVLIAPHIPPEAAAEIFSDPRALIAWGPPNGCHARPVPGGYRVSGRWDFASGCRQATWMGVHAHVEEPDGSLRLNAAGRPTVRTLLFPAGGATLLDTWNPIGLRGTASDSYTVDDLFVPDIYSGTREDPAGRNVPGPLYAFTMQGLYAVGVSGVGLGVAREMLAELVKLAARKAPRGQSRLADQALVQAQIAHAEARLASAEAYLQAILADIYANADEWGVIGTEDRARVRLGCANAIHGAIEVADTVHKLAGVDAIFPGSPFERRFRDIHTLSQQIQSRTSHFEAVGRILLGADDATFL
ncbi:MAG: acyl-CoA dehydrogenase family protein [Hyphomicrobiaceae bacterium]